jgi:UDP-N-acetylglucosamine/UDP-N-acetylgalactosamine 4-epimerase
MNNLSKFETLKGKHILVTGGAGFIGSNLVESLLEIGAIVTVLDNLATGFKENLTAFENHPNFTFTFGDITNFSDCLSNVEGKDGISHQAALGSVPRSIEFPHNTHDANATGFLNMLQAAKEKEVKRFVYASSSSVYGDSLASPKVEGMEGFPLSPYAVTKQLNERYARVYAQLHAQETIGLRYFNVFGPRQNPEGAYAAAIPRFIDKMRKGEEIIINGDGEQTRDFTFVKNAVQANLLALSTTNSLAFGEVFNVACGDSYSINTVIETIKGKLKLLGKLDPSAKITFGPIRNGDVKDSLADISKLTTILGYKNPISFSAGIEKLCSL